MYVLYMSCISIYVTPPPKPKDNFIDINFYQQRWWHKRGGVAQPGKTATDSLLSRVRVARTRTTRPEIQPHSSQQHTHAHTYTGTHRRAPVAK